MHRDWEDSKPGSCQIRVSVMKNAVVAKFTQNPKLKDLLLSTYPLKLVENSENDYFWGAGKDKTGMNMLERILEDIRDNILLPELIAVFDTLCVKELNNS